MMGTEILKIDAEMAEKIEVEVGNPNYCFRFRHIFTSRSVIIDKYHRRNNCKAKKTLF